MFPSLYIALLLAQYPEVAKPKPLDRAAVTQSGEQGQLTWTDAEDSVSGSFSPFAPEAGGDLEVVVRVGAMQGAAFEGPVTLGLTPQNGVQGDSKTVSMNPGSKAWAAQLKVDEAGPYWLEIGYTTTRRKVVRAEVVVQDARLPRWPWWVILGLVGALALFFGVRAVLGHKS